jgi:translation initiation factor 6 (eIF-6)
MSESQLQDQYIQHLEQRSRELEDLEHKIQARGGLAVIDDNKAKAVLYDALEQENAELKRQLQAEYDDQAGASL